MGYRCGAADLCAAGVGAQHNRSRLYWVSDCKKKQRTAWGLLEKGKDWAPQKSDRRLHRIYLDKIWWQSQAGFMREPLLVRSFNGISSVVGGIGNAIVPQVAAEFIGAFLKC